MLHPVRVPPPTSRGSLPPWMFPRGIPSAALHTKQQVPSSGRSRASPIHGSLSLAFSARNMPPARRAAVPAYPRFRSAPPPPASPPPPPRKRCSTPRLRHRAPPASNSFFFSRQSSRPSQSPAHVTPCLQPPKIPVSMREELRFVESGDVVGVFPSRCRLRALWRQALSSSFPALPHS
jgi:hypothetical protein